MFTLVLVALLGVSFLCTLVLLAAMIVASRASARTVDAWEQMQHLSRTQPAAMGDGIQMNAESIPQFHSTTLATHRNIAEELCTHSESDCDQQSPQSAKSPLPSSSHTEQPAQIKSQS